MAIAVGVVVLLLLVVGGAGLWGIRRLITVRTSHQTEADIPQGSPAAAEVESTSREAPPSSQAPPPPIEEAAPQDVAAGDDPAPPAVGRNEGRDNRVGRGLGLPRRRALAGVARQRELELDPTLRADPPVEIHCQGLSDACASLRSELENSLRRAGLPLAGADAPEVVVTFVTEEIESRSEEQFGTTFVVRTYSMEAAGQAPRFGEAVSMPPPEVFSFDTRLGRERLNERSRALSEAVTRSIRQYWSRRSQ